MNVERAPKARLDEVESILARCDALVPEAGSKILKRQRVKRGPFGVAVVKLEATKNKAKLPQLEPRKVQNAKRKRKAMLSYSFCNTIEYNGENSIDLAAEKAMLPSSEESNSTDLGLNHLRKSILPIPDRTPATQDFIIDAWTTALRSDSPLFEKRKESSRTLNWRNSMHTYRSIAARQKILNEFSDRQLLDEALDSINLQFEKKSAEHQAVTIHGKKSEHTLLKHSSQLLKEFPRFVHLLRLCEFERKVNVKTISRLQENRSSAWLLRLIEEAYDALFLNLMALQRTPDIVASWLWRTLGRSAPQTALSLLESISRAEACGCREAALFASFLSEKRTPEELALFLHTRQMLEVEYAISFRRVTQRIIRGPDGRISQSGCLPRRDGAPVLTSHPTFGTATLRDAQSPFYDASILSVALPRNAIVKLVRALIGGTVGVEQAISDELASRGISAREASRKRTKSHTPCRRSTPSPDALARELIRMLMKTIEPMNPNTALMSQRTDSYTLAFPSVAQADDSSQGMLNSKEYADIFRILEGLVEIIAQAPSDIISFLKYDDDGERISMLDSLRLSLKDTETAKETAVQVKEAKHAVARAKAHAQRTEAHVSRLEVLKQDASDIGTQIRAKTVAMLAQGELSRAQSVLAKRQTELATLQGRADMIWDSLMSASATVQLKNASGHSCVDTIAATSPQTHLGLRVLRACVARSALTKSNLRGKPRERSQNSNFEAYSADAAPLLYVESLTEPRDYVLRDHTDILAPLVQLQNDSACVLQRWARKLKNPEKAHTQPAFKRLLQDDEKQIRYVQQVEKKNDDQDEEIAESRDLMLVLRGRKQGLDASRAVVEKEKVALCRLQEFEVNRRYAFKSRFLLGQFLLAWCGLVRARRYGLGHMSRLLRAIIYSWSAMTKKTIEERECAVLIQKYSRKLVAKRVVKSQRCFLNRIRNTALACYGRSIDRLMTKVVKEWKRWTKFTVQSKHMALTLFKKILVKQMRTWYYWVILSPTRRQRAARILQHHFRFLFASAFLHIHERRRLIAVVKIQTLYRGRKSKMHANLIRVEQKTKLQSLRRHRAVYDLRMKIGRRSQELVFIEWRRTVKLRIASGIYGGKNLLRRVFSKLAKNIQDQIDERYRIQQEQEVRANKIVHSWITRWRFLRVLRIYRAARKIQTLLIRPYLARQYMYDLRELQYATQIVQRFRRGEIGRRRIRAINRHRLLVSAYINDSEMLVRSHNAAIKLTALNSTRIDHIKHKAAGDLLLHRAARGLAATSLSTCLHHFGLNADCINDTGSTALHVIGAHLAPPVETMSSLAEAARIREEERKVFAGKGPLRLSDIFDPAAVLANIEMPGNETSDFSKNGGAVTVDVFGDWFEEQNCKKVPADSAIYNIGENFQKNEEDAVSCADSITSKMSECETALALMTAAEIDEKALGVPDVVSIVDALLHSGADLEAIDNNGRTPLLTAIQRGDLGLVGILLERGASTDVVDYEGHTALILAAKRGYAAIGRQLLRAGANPNARGQKSRTAMHEVCKRASHSYAPRFLRALLSAGARVDLKDDDEKSTLAHCCACPPNEHYSNEETDQLIDNESVDTPEREVLQLLLEQGVDPYDRDSDGATMLHLAAKANRVDAVAGIIDICDVDVSAKNSIEATPLHIAAQAGSLHTLRALLRRGADTRTVDKQGNQPIHYACIGGNVKAIEHLLSYGAQLTCRNWSGQTPIGIARMNGRHKVIQYLLNTVVPNSLDVRGDAANIDDESAEWSRPIAESAAKWRQEWSGAEGLSDCKWTNIETGETRSVPPATRVSKITELARQQWPETILKREHIATRAEDKDISVGAAEYEQERSEHEAQVIRLRQENTAAIKIQSKWRRLDAINLTASMRARREAARKIERMGRWRRSEDFRVAKEREDSAASRLQKIFRGRDARRDFHEFLYERLWWRRAERRLAVQLQRLWKGHTCRKFLKRTRCIRYGPQGFIEWQAALKASGKAKRTFGVYEERFFPCAFDKHNKSRPMKGKYHDVVFYYNRVSGACFWEQPLDWKEVDLEEYEERKQMRALGFTKREERAALSMQALWKGRQNRLSLKAFLEGSRVMRSCEAEYLMYPRNTRKLVHYTLFLHCMKEDVDRARPLYHDALERMTQRGPDDTWILCSYAIFLAATGTDDWDTIVDMAERGRKACEGPMGEIRRSYELAANGFFRAATAYHPKSSWAWHNLALVRQLVYHDYSGAKENYVRAVLCDPHDTLIIDNFQNLLRTHCPDKEITCYDIVRTYSTGEMLRDLAIHKRKFDAMRRDPQCQEMALRLQMAWRRRQFRKDVMNYARQQMTLEVNINTNSPAAANVKSDSLTENLTCRWEIQEAENGQKFYHDTMNCRSTWDTSDNSNDILPHGDNLHPKEDSSDVPVEEILTIEQEDPHATSLMSLHPDYEQHIDDSGNVYYYHVPSGESTWYLPEYIPTVDEDPSIANTKALLTSEEAGIVGYEWECHFDESSGRHFYYCCTTGQSQWNPPDDPLALRHSGSTLS